MNNTETSNNSLSRYQIAVIFLLGSILVVLITFTLMYSQLSTKTFTPVQLTDKEKILLQDKLNIVEKMQIKRRSTKSNKPIQSNIIKPEPYTELNAQREIHFTERELNALLANNSQLAQKVTIDLSTDLASAKVLLPIDPEFPVLGGKILKLSTGLELQYTKGQPVVKLVGVSLWGVPLPNAWLGGLKNIDLVKEFGDETGFWQAFADGVNNLQVIEGSLLVQLKE